jgi:hypothetical protein
MEEQKRYLKKWDVFISYASEDGDTIARPLAAGLQRYGLRVWFDECELHVGDHLAESINRGLANSSYGVVVLSPNFLSKKWPQRELAALMSLEEVERKRILPVWHQLGAKELKESLPMLVDIVAVQSSMGIAAVVRELLRAINLPSVGENVTGVWTGQTGRLRLFEVEGKLQGDYDWNGHQWAGHIEGSLETASGPDFLPFPILKFNWWWDLSAEKGNGFFVVAVRTPGFGYGRSYHTHRAPGYRSMHEGADSVLLTGTWAFDYENLDLSQSIRDLAKSRPHAWDFRRGRSGTLMDADILKWYANFDLPEEGEPES